MEHLLIEFVVRAALIAAGTAAVLRILRVRTAAARHVAWAGVVALMLLLPVWTAWGPKAWLQILPAAAAPAASRATVPAETVSGLALPGLLDQTPRDVVPAPIQRPVWNWPACLAGIYLLGACVLLARLAVGTARAHLLVRRAARHGGRLTSDSCAAPVTVGWLTPAVILPECWQRWPQAQLDAVLTHEGEHARRRDPLVQWLALLNRAVFWFHPLAWWLEFRLSALAEEACDAAVLARGHDRFEYSEYLLEMARSVLRTGARVKVLGMAMPGSFLPQRIRRILEGRPAQRISRARMVCMAVACAVVSAVFTAGAVDRRTPEQRSVAPVVIVQAPPVKEAPAQGVLAYDTRPKPAARPVLLAQVQAAAGPAAPAQTAPAQTAPAQTTTAPQDKYKDRRMLVLYFDLAAMPIIDRARAFASAQEFVRTKMQSHDLLAIMTASDGVKVWQDFTDDRDRLLQTLDQLTADSVPESSAAVDVDQQLTRLHTAVNMLGSLQGKKALVYFAASAARADSTQLQPLIDAAIRANVAFYPVDSRGLIQDQPADAQQRQLDEALQKLQELAKRQQELAAQQKGQQATTDQRWQQEMLRREAERLQQELDQLNRIQQLSRSGQQSQPPAVGGAYIVGAEDVLQVWVNQRQGISGQYAVRTDGMISVLLIWDVRAAGLTVSQLEAVIADRLEANGIVSHPSVTVGVFAVHSPIR
jgi:VWFA-related protein